jgi:glycogen debranching enzyme
MTEQEITDKAKELFKINDTGIFIKPGSHQYPHQWNWDVGFNAIGLSYFDIDRAKLEMRSLLSGQWKTGMIPHILYHHGPSDYFPTPDFWQTGDLDVSPEFVTSGITQLPILATGVKLMFRGRYQDEETLSFIKEVFPKILAWHKWWYKARDPQDIGLVSIIHPWESTDNSPSWDTALENIHLDFIPEYSRKDKAHVNEEERPVEDHYKKYMYLINFYRNLKWDDDLIIKETPFLVQCTLVNVLLHQANKDLIFLGELIGADVTEIKEWVSKGADAMERLWDEEDGLYYNFDVRTNTPIKENTWAGLSPLFAGIPTKERADFMIKSQLLNTKKYAPSFDSDYYFPCVSKDNPKYEPLRYWRGPIWMSSNWLLMLGLRQYGYNDLAKKIKEDSLHLVKKSGFVEYFDPRDGAPKGAGGFSWTAAIALDMILENDVVS